MLETSLGAHTIPDTRRGRVYQRILLVAALCAVVGMADAARALFWSGLPLVAGGSAELTPRELLHVLIRLVAWGLVGWAAWRGVSRKLLPPEWVVLALPVLVWITLLA
jgi:hypothetical protein